MFYAIKKTTIENVKVIFKIDTWDITNNGRTEKNNFKKMDFVWKGNHLVIYYPTSVSSDYELEFEKYKQEIFICAESINEFIIRMSFDFHTIETGIWNNTALNNA